MKSLFLAGGFAGFVLCAAAGLWAGRSPDLILRDASVGCLAGALILRWLWLMVVRGFRETLVAKRRAAAAAAEAPPPRPTAAPASAPAAGPRAMPLVNPKPATR